MYTATLSVISGAPHINGITYTMQRSITDSTPYELASNTTQQACTFYATLPGTWDIKAHVIYNGSRDTTLFIRMRCHFPKWDMILNGNVSTGGTVRGAMDQAWTRTKLLATATGCAEVGFVIYLVTSQTGSYYNCSEVVEQTSTYDIRASVMLSPEQDILNGFDPLLQSSFYVADFHTHPPLSKWVGSGALIRKVGPAKLTDDSPHYDSPGRNEIPSFVYDYIGNNGEHESKDSIDSPAKIYRFGGNQRNSNYYAQED